MALSRRQPLEPAQERAQIIIQGYQACLRTSIVPWKVRGKQEVNSKMKLELDSPARCTIHKELIHGSGVRTRYSLLPAPSPIGLALLVNLQHFFKDFLSLALSLLSTGLVQL